MIDKTVTLDKNEVALLVGGLIMLGNNYAEKLEEAQNDENKVPCFSCDLEGKSLEEFMYENLLESIRDLWEKIDPEDN